MNHNHCDHTSFLKWFLSWKGIMLTVALAAVSYYLYVQHLEHLAIALPYVILLACPLMHIFGHRHGKHNDQKENKE